jgi:membrane-bound lytic murein transglycosylase B
VWRRCHGTEKLVHLAERSAIFTACCLRQADARAVRSQLEANMHELQQEQQAAGVQQQQLQELHDSLRKVTSVACSC